MTDREDCYPTFVDPRADRAAYKQLADIFRAQITIGFLPPGAQLPSEIQTAGQYQVQRETVRQAVAILRGEGLVDTERGRGTRVRLPTQRDPIRLGPHDRATARMPQEPERHEHELPEGVPIIEIRRADGTTEIHPADRVELLNGS